VPLELGWVLYFPTLLTVYNRLCTKTHRRKIQKKHKKNKKKQKNNGDNKEKRQQRNQQDRGNKETGKTSTHSNQKRQNDGRMGSNKGGGREQIGQ
jgi:hypothetical protein